jgi:argininosuccinate lyase
MKLWGGRFNKPTDILVEQYNASIHFDKRLASYDILGSIAHVAMLAHCGIISHADATTIKNGLAKVAEKITDGHVTFRVSDEDIHMNIERVLTEEIGEVAGKLHTGRSRNDQVALDIRLFLRDHSLAIIHALVELQSALLQQAQQHCHTILPGYTHLQRAQPIVFGHHLHAYIMMFQRDIERLQTSWSRINTLPLGAGALAGTTFPIDRQYVADQLHFDAICQNSIDAVSDRDFIVEFMANAALIMTHISRLSEELILWSSQEFAFIELDDAFCTGSSMMPQKKNPDVAELGRGKTGRVYGALMGILTTLKGLPLTYNKDMQEDKEGLFDTVDTLHITLTLFANMLNSMKINKHTMRAAASRGFTQATDLADYLVNKNIPFRQAHKIIGELVQHCIQKNCQLDELSLETLQTFHQKITPDVFQAIDLDNIVAARNILGGTAPLQVKQQLEQSQATLDAITQWLEEKYALTQTLP